MAESFAVQPVARVESSLTERSGAPKQGHEGGVAAWLVFSPEVADAAADLSVGDGLVLLTWFDRADRSVQRVHPRDDMSAPQRGVFSTRSPDRPNPIGLHRVRVVGVDGLRFQVQDLEAVDRTPILDVKPVLAGARDA